jgi:DNA-binding response OmpR family regulator
MPDQLLIVDDDRFLLENLKRLLQREGYGVSTATSGEEALSLVATEPCDLMILDLGLPGVDGLSTCRRIRGKHNFPVIMLTARSDAMDKVIGLEVGADDYLTKPFEPIELLARVRAHLRRSREYRKTDDGPESNITVGDLLIDFEKRDVLIGEKLAELTTREFELIAHLARNAGRVVPREALFERVWGYDMAFNSNSLEVYIYRIRKKVEQDPNNPRYMKTVRGYGYSLNAQ